MKLIFKIQEPEIMTFMFTYCFYDRLKQVGPKKRLENAFKTLTLITFFLDITIWSKIKTDNLDAVLLILIYSIWRKIFNLKTIKIQVVEVSPSFLRSSDGTVHGQINHGIQKWFMNKVWFIISYFNMIYNKLYDIFGRS